jgi:hypothetical protein
METTAYLSQYAGVNVPGCTSIFLYSMLEMVQYVDHLKILLVYLMQLLQFQHGINDVYFAAYTDDGSKIICRWSS